MSKGFILKTDGNIKTHTVLITDMFGSVLSSLGCILNNQSQSHVMTHMESLICHESTSAGCNLLGNLCMMTFTAGGIHTVWMHWEVDLAGEKGQRYYLSRSFAS